MDDENRLDAEPAHNESEKEIISTDPSVAQQSAQLSIDVENAAGNVPPANADQQLAPRASNQENIVDWDGPQDPQNPQNWTSTRKWRIIILVSTITFNQYAFPPTS